MKLFIRKHKVECAKKWLDDSEMMVSEIAYRLGYESLSNFSRMFHKEVGI